MAVLKSIPAGAVKVGLPFRRHGDGPPGGPAVSRGVKRGGGSRLG